MYFKIFFTIIITSSFFYAADTLSIRNDFNQYFANCRTGGCILIYDYKNKMWITNDTSQIEIESLPASTFKIINTLIALETGVIKNEKQVIRWNGHADTALYGYRPEIYKDMTIKEAFQVSAVWVFIELAKQIGKQRYEQYLEACSYGNLDLTQPDEDFWNFGKYGVTPVQQIKLLKNLYEGKLPFLKKNMDIVKSVMITETTEDYIIRAKTGWARSNGKNIGWWIGYIEVNDLVYFFATRLIQDRKINQSDFSQCRKEITKAVLKSLKIIH